MWAIVHAALAQNSRTALLMPWTALHPGSSVSGDG
jgi:hypothetical protein